MKTAKQLKYKLGKYSKVSLIMRMIVSVFLIATIALVIVFKEDISRKVYKWSAETSLENPEFEVHVIDVGQGDATLIKFDDGKSMLVDCGPKSAKESLVAYLSSQNVSTIDYFLLTHADADHVGCGAAVFENFEIKNFYRPMMLASCESEPAGYPTHDTLTYSEVITAYRSEEGANMFYNSSAVTIEGENYTINLLYPDAVYSANNDTSAVLQVNLGGKKFLLMGDAEIKVENKLVDEYGTSLKCDVLKVGHHGAKTSTGEKLLEAAKPTYAAISVGRNSFGHPTQEALTNLKNYNVQYFTTQECGNIVFDVAYGKLVCSAGGGQMIDYALICSVLGIILLLTWGIPDIKRKKEAATEEPSTNIDKMTSTKKKLKNRRK